MTTMMIMMMTMFGIYTAEQNESRLYTDYSLNPTVGVIAGESVDSTDGQNVPRSERLAHDLPMTLGRRYLIPESVRSAPVHASKSDAV